MKNIHAHRSRTISHVESIEIECDSNEERNEIGAFLISKGLIQSDGMLGDQHDFSLCGEIKKGKTRNYIILQDTHGQASYAHALILKNKKFKLR